MCLLAGIDGDINLNAMIIKKKKKQFGVHLQKIVSKRYKTINKRLLYIVFIAMIPIMKTRKNNSVFVRHENV